MLSILGGVGLIFFGVRFLRKGLDRLFGGHLMRWLSNATDHPLKALITGLGIGTVAPSSTGASIMTVQMLDSGQMNPANMLAVLLGTNIGITVAVQLLAFRLQDYAGLMIFGGMLAFQFLRRELLRGCGQCLLALGFVFLAIDIIGSGAMTLSAHAEVKEVLHTFSVFPWVLLIIVSILSMLLQSSTASIGLCIAMATGGLLDQELLGWWVVGTNLGVGLTSLGVGWGSLDGRRMGTANLLAKLLVVGALLFIPNALTTLFHCIPGTLERQAAMLHTNFNLLVALVTLPFLPFVWKAMKWIYPDQTIDTFAPQESFLNLQSLGAPPVALARASRECMRMAEHTRFMLEQFWCAYTTRDRGLAQRVQKEDDAIDTINLALKDYLIRIDDGLAPAEVQWQFALHGIASELEAIGDVIDKNLCDILLKQIHDNVLVDGWEAIALEEVFQKLLTRFEVGLGLLTTRETSAVAPFLESKEELNGWILKCQQEHYASLNLSSPIRLSASASFLDLLNGIRRVNAHINVIGYAVATRSDTP